MKKIFIFLLLAGGCFLFFGLKVSATVNTSSAMYRSAFIVERGPWAQAIVFSTPTLNMGAGEEAPLLEISWSETDNSNYSGTYLMLTYNSNYNYFTLNGSNGQVVFYPNVYYVFNIYRQLNVDTFDIYQVVYNYDTATDTVSYQVGQLIYSYVSPYRVSDILTNPLLTMHGNTYGQYKSGLAGDIYSTSTLNHYLNDRLLSTDEITTEAYYRGYAVGASAGYESGFADGQQGKTSINKVWDFMSGMFGAIGAIFSIELFPHIPLGIFILVPLFFGAVGLILWIWRRN